MLSAIASLLLLANTPDSQTTLPRHPDPDPGTHQSKRDGEPTDPWFDRDFVATDDPAFVLTAVESVRQGVFDARGAEARLDKAELRAAAEQIRRQNESTAKKLETLATTKGWRLPEPNPGREGNGANGGAATPRSNADFILNQIMFHQNTLSQYRAQIAGKGDAELKRALREAVPGYQKNLELLLTVKP